MFKKTITAVLLAVALLAGCLNRGQQSETQAPDFTLKDLAGKKVTLSEYRGKVVLLEFWATWCPPCRAAIPGLEKLHTTYKDKGLIVLAISMDEGGWDEVKAFARDYGITFTVLRVNEDVVAKYQVRSIPMTLLVNKEGKIVKRYLGLGGDDDLEKDIRPIL